MTRYLLLHFFDTADELFKRFAVPDDLKTVLLTPHLTQKARSLLTRIDPTNTSRGMNLLNSFYLNNISPYAARLSQSV